MRKESILFTLLIISILLPVVVNAGDLCGPISDIGTMNQTENMTMNMTENMTANMTANMTMNMTASDLSWNVSYFLRDASRTLTGEKIQRDVDNDLLSLYGGNAIAGGLGGILSLYGKDTVNPNAVEVVVGDNGVGNLLVTSWKAGADPLMSMNGWNITGIMRIENATDAVNLSFVQGMNQSLFTNLSGSFATTAYVDAVNNSMRNNVSQYVISVNDSIRANVSAYVIAVNDSMRNNVSQFVISANQSLFTNLSTTISSANQSLFTNLSATFTTTAYVDAVNNSMRNNVSQFVISANQSLFTNLTATIASSNQSLFTNLTATIVSANQSLFTNLTAYINAVNLSNMNNMSQYVIAVNNSMRANVSSYVISVNDSMRNNVSQYVIAVNASQNDRINIARLDGSATTTSLVGGNITGLKWIQRAYDVVQFDCVIRSGSSVATGVKAGMFIPASSVLMAEVDGSVKSTSGSRIWNQSIVTVNGTMTTELYNMVADQNGLIRYSGTLKGGGTAGEPQILLATFTAGTVTANAGSYCKWMRLQSTTAGK